MQPPAGSDRLAKRPFGPTELTVTPIGMGCAAFGDMPETFQYSVAESDALQAARELFAGPLNFIDTAASYGDGESERRIGLVLKELGGLPNGCVLATKADRDLTSGDFSGDQMRRSVERSLRLPGLDRLQVVHLHDPEWIAFEEAMAPGGPVEVLVRLKEEGVIDHLGVAGGPIELMIRFVETGAFEAVISHNRYTLLNRSASPLFDIASERGLAVLNAAPFGSGILSRGPDSYPRYAYRRATDEVVERARELGRACARHGVPLAAAALQFSLRDPRITSTIVGFSRPQRVRQAVELAAHPVPDELWKEIESSDGWAGDPESTRTR